MTILHLRLRRISDDRRSYILLVEAFELRSNFEVSLSSVTIQSGSSPARNDNRREGKDREKTATQTAIQLLSTVVFINIYRVALRAASSDP